MLTSTSITLAKFAIFYGKYRTARMLFVATQAVSETGLSIIALSGKTGTKTVRNPFHPSAIAPISVARGAGSD
jgi:hypothetical protein